MNEYDKQIPLISIHIPKCGGASFRTVLKYWFKSNLFFHYHNEKLNIQPVKHRLIPVRRLKSLFNQKNICIHGHFNWKRGNGVEDYYPEVNQFITMLRDPFEIHISNYFYVKRVGNKAYLDGKRNIIVQDKYDFKTYIEKYPKSFLLSFFPPEISMDNYHELLEERFVYIGITEDLQTSVDMLAKKLDLPSKIVPHKNISKRGELIPEECRNIFINENPLEIAIYEWALKHYKD